MHRLLTGLNLEQSQAASLTEGYVRVLAGAGTGKTKTLTVRYAYIIGALGISPGAALCVTFTNKAASEMKRRIRALLGDSVRPQVATFHGFCCEFLHEEAAALGIAKNFSLWSVQDVRDALKPLYKELHINGRELPLQEAWDYIDARKSLPSLAYVNEFLSPDSNFLSELEQKEQSVKGKLFYRYLQQQRMASSLDFDDLIAFTLHLLRIDEEIRERWQKRLQYLMIDEFQDIDVLQYELCECLASRSGNLFIVGDPDQTIYSFRGADVKLFTGFNKRHPQAKCFVFTKNYRSQRGILEAAYALISHNGDTGRLPLEAVRKDIKMQDMVKIFNLPDDEDENLGDLLKIMQEHARTDALSDPKFTQVDEGHVSMLPAVVFAVSATQQAEYIAAELKALYESHPKSSAAVLFRAHHVSDDIERALIRNGIHYTLLSGRPFLERSEIRVTLGYLRLCLNPDDDQALKLTVNEPKRGFGKKRLQRLTDDAAVEGTSLFSQLYAHADDPLYTKGTRIKSYLTVVTELHKDLISLKPTRALERVLNGTLYEEHLKDAGDQEALQGLSALRQLAQDFEQNEGESTNIADFVSFLVLSSSAFQDKDLNAVKLMSVHAAKGLEFDYVFLAGLDEGIFPSAKSETPEALEEERRLLYVAMTRAKKQLFMLSGGRVKGFDSGGSPSRFFADLRSDLILQVGSYERDGRYTISNAGHSRFKSGDQVFHEVFGPGKVLQVNEAHGEYLIEFSSLKQERTLGFDAPLEEYVLT